jgi:hypothetical protein
MFNFDKYDVSRFVTHDLRIVRNTKECFDFLVAEMTKAGQHHTYEKDDHIDLENLMWREGKSYNWTAITKGNVQIIIREFGLHYTLFCINTESNEFEGRTFIRRNLTMFTFLSSPSDEEHDHYSDFKFEDINLCLPEIIKEASEDNLHRVDSIKTKPDHTTIKIAFNREVIHSYDVLFYCLEEISREHLAMYAETTMEILRSIEPGMLLEGREIIEVFAPSEDFIVDDDTYFHGYGLKTTERTYIYDVYTLTRYYSEEILKIVAQ